MGETHRLYIVVPLFMYALTKRPRFAMGLCTTVIIGSMALRVVYCLVYELGNRSDVDIPVCAFFILDPKQPSTIKIIMKFLYTN